MSFFDLSHAPRILYSKAGFDKPVLDQKLCLFWPFKKRSELIKSRSYISNELRPQFQKKLTELEKSKTSSGSQMKIQNLDLYTSQGGHIKIVYFEDEELSTYQLQSQLRQSVADFLAGSSENLLIDLEALEARLQERVLYNLGALGLLTRWKFPAVKSEPNAAKKSRSQKEKRPPAWTLYSSLGQREAGEVFRVAQLFAAANNLVRSLAETPANLLTPKQYLQRVAKLVASSKGAAKLKSEFFDEKKLERLGAGAFLAVSKGAPRLGSGILKLSFLSKARKGQKKVALVGKGLCFDTGGYNVKTGSYMYGMKHDMTGSAVALASFLFLIEAYGEKLGADLELYMALAENHISPEAFKANDVVVALNGKSIEIVDTDAEGRMVLADTLALAAKGEPDLIIDFATLTGSVRRAIDTQRSGVFANHEELLDQAVKAGNKSGERVWPFPSGEEFRAGLKSELADILQCQVSGNADHIYAATFLEEFVPQTCAWLHLDLAASSQKGGLGLIPTETTGFGVAWTHAFVRDFLAAPGR